MQLDSCILVYSFPNEICSLAGKLPGWRKYEGFWGFCIPPFKSQQVYALWQRAENRWQYLTLSGEMLMLGNLEDRPLSHVPLSSWLLPKPSQLQYLAYMQAIEGGRCLISITVRFSVLWASSYIMPFPWLSLLQDPSAKCEAFLMLVTRIPRCICLAQLCACLKTGNIACSGKKNQESHFRATPVYVLVVHSITTEGLHTKYHGEIVWSLARSSMSLVIAASGSGTTSPVAYAQNEWFCTSRYALRAPPFSRLLDNFWYSAIFESSMAEAWFFVKKRGNRVAYLWWIRFVSHSNLNDERKKMMEVVS